MPPNSYPLTPDALRRALNRIAAQRLAPDEPIACPICEAPGLNVVDRSTRPYAEWYAIACSSCGLDTTIHIPLGPAVPGGMD